MVSCPDESALGDLEAFAVRCVMCALPLPLPPAYRTHRTPTKYACRVAVRWCFTLGFT
jgi:hypothetical protein